MNGPKELTIIRCRKKLQINLRSDDLMNKDEKFMNFSILSTKVIGQHSQVDFMFRLYALTFDLFKTASATLLNLKKYNNLRPARLFDAIRTKGLSGYGCGDNLNDNKNVNRCKSRGRNSCSNRTWKPS